jgi:hypothetical protein
MKTKYLFVLAFALITQLGYGQKSVDDLFKTFAGKENVERVSIGSFVMNTINLFKNTMGVKGVEVLSLDDCSEDVKNDFQNAVRALKDPTFERMVVTNEGKERVEVLIRIENEVIREVAMMVTGEDYALIRIKGKIKKSDIEKLSKKNF